MFSDCYEKLWQKKYLVALFFFSRSTTVSWWMMFVIWGEEYCEDSFLGSAIFTFTHCFLSSCKSTPSFSFLKHVSMKSSSKTRNRLIRFVISFEKTPWDALCIRQHLVLPERWNLVAGAADWMWGNGGILRNFNIQEAWWLLLIVWWGQWAGHSKWIEVVRALDLRGKQRLSRKKSSIAPHAVCRVLEYFF